MTAIPTHAELATTLARLRLGVGASELHGSLVGYLCAGGRAGAGDWPVALELDHGDGGFEDTVFARLHHFCREQLDDEDLGFEPLLPDDNEPLARRGDALVEWCRGFLGGVGLAGSAGGAALSGDAREILGDLAANAGSRFDYDDDDGDETALVEVLEFIRVGVLLLHEEMNHAPRRRAQPAASSRRIH